MMQAILAIFPLLYIGVFFAGMKRLLQGNPEGLLLFIVFGLPVYLTSLSVTHMLGFGNFIPVLQAFKEVLVLIALLTILWQLRNKPVPGTTDWLLLLYLGYAFLYLAFPSGYSFREKLLALKGLAFFPLLYFVGRLVTPGRINLQRWLHYICMLAIAAGALVAYEAFTDQHFQQNTGYADYNFYYFNVEPAGNYGLTWTFESGSGHKRFASFFSMPLEHAAATLLAVSAIFALSFQKWGRYTLPPFLQLTLAATLLSIVFALSRAAFAGYFIMFYVYAVAARKKQWLRWIHGSILLLALAWLLWLQGDIMEWVMETVQFTDTSSLSHLLEWLDGIEAMRNNPLGLGLAASGRVSGALGENVGGENQLIIIGVQLGVVGLLLYAAVYVQVIRQAISAFRNGRVKEARLGLMLFLTKVGLVIPLMTAELESYIYISYLTWFLSGLLVNMCEQHKKTYARVPAFGY